MEIMPCRGTTLKGLSEMFGIPLLTGNKIQTLWWYKTLGNTVSELLITKYVKNEKTI